MAIGDNYASPQDLKSYLSIPDGKDDIEVTMALGSVSRAIEQFCGRQFNLETAASARVYYPDRFDFVTIDDFYTTSGFVLATDEDGDGVYETTWDSANYELQPLNGIVDGWAGWPYYKIRGIRQSFPINGCERAPIQVTAKWGWAAVPGPVHQACLILGAEALKLKESVFGVGGYGQFGIIKVRDNPIAARCLMPYAVNRLLVG